ncbi:phosphotransferase [Rhodobacteraceae bacterium KMM 6894]|nr:phosphotransferase [Rhodobacteraceae bacterium KMM 6894]
MIKTQAVQSGGLPPTLSGVLSDTHDAKADLLAQDPPAVTPVMAAELAQQYYGIMGDVRPLSAEKDANFLIRLPNGEAALLKITNAVEDRAVTQMQTAALMHLAAVDPTLPVPRICASLNGNSSEVVRLADGQDHVMRLMTFLDGTILSGATPAPGLRYALGAFLARVTLGLRGFFHPAAGHVLQWDIKQAARLRPLLASVQDTTLRARLTATLDRFETDIAPRLMHLRAQVVHNDYNPHNVLVDGPIGARPVGLIDFGDMVHTPIACDLAVACSYQIGEGAAPLEGMCRLISGYHSLIPLEPAEIDLLPDLVRLRQTTTLAIGAWRAQRYPDNAAYILRNAAASLRGMDALDRMGDAATRAALHTAAPSE